MKGCETILLSQMHFGQIVVHFPAHDIYESSNIQGMRIDLLRLVFTSDGVGVVSGVVRALMT